MRRRSIVSLLALAALVHQGGAQDQNVKVRYRVGAMRGFLALRDQKGKLLASGELSQVPRGNTITIDTSFHFLDGSLYEETTVYSQRLTFRLISDHLVQKGPSFPNPCEMKIDMRSQSVSMLVPSKDGKPAKPEHMNLPPDLSNGLLFNLIQNLPNGGPKVTVSYLAPISKPRLLRYAISLLQEGTVTVADRSVKTAEWNVKAELGGVAGVVAPIVGKQPPDMHVWVAEDGLPTILRIDAALYSGGPVWSIQLANPVW
jgi:hypothetical protein